MSKSITHATWLGGVLLALVSGAPATSYALEEESDNASLRRQAMDEWYNESYDQHNNGVRGWNGGNLRSGRCTRS